MISYQPIVFSCVFPLNGWLMLAQHSQLKRLIHGRQHGQLLKHPAFSVFANDDSEQNKGWHMLAHVGTTHSQLFRIPKSCRRENFRRSLSL